MGNRAERGIAADYGPLEGKATARKILPRLSSPAPRTERFHTVATLDKSLYDAMSMERPALVRTDEGRWRLYTCCATKGTEHWWVDVLAADDPESLVMRSRERLPR